jgi:hypothetical protein
LFFGGVTSGAPRETADSREKRVDAGITVGHELEGDPVADGRKLRADPGAVAQASGDARQRLAVFNGNAINMRVLENDSCRNAARRRDLRERRGKAVVPTVLLETGAHSRNDYMDGVDTFVRQRRTSATLHACATQPRGT